MVGVYELLKAEAGVLVGVPTGCCHCTGGGYTIVIERGAGMGGGSSDQFFT